MMLQDDEWTEEYRDLYAMLHASDQFDVDEETLRAEGLIGE